MNNKKPKPTTYTYYFVRVADKHLADLPAQVTLDLSDIPQELIDRLHDRDKKIHANNEYQRRLSSKTNKNPERLSRHILGPEEAFFENERNARLYDAMDKLTPRQRLLVESVIIDGETKVAVAARLGVDESAVRHQLTAALAKLRKNFTND